MPQQNQNGWAQRDEANSLMRIGYRRRDIEASPEEKKNPNNGVSDQSVRFILVVAVALIVLGGLYYFVKQFI